jgi:DNA-binding transcriptional regulator YiaG
MPITLTGQWVKDQREKLGISQAELARALGYTRANISKWESRRERSIPRTQYERVLNYLLSRQEALRALAARLQTNS